MVRSPCCEKLGLKKGPWTPEEDQKLLAYIQKHGHGSWRALPAKAGLDRCGKSCRLRWTNYLRPDIKRGKFSVQEEQSIIQLHALLGNRWSAIATHLPKRTDNEIKNYWNTHLKKRLDKMGIDPVTHRPKMDAFTSCTGNAKDVANLSHMAQWESARLEAEARLVRESKLIQNQIISSSIKAGPRPPRPPCLDVLKAWQNVVSGMFFAASNGADTLESPTSPLNFSEISAMVTIPTIGRNQDNYMKILDYKNNNNNNNNNNNGNDNSASGSDGGVVMASSAWSSGEFVKRENEDNLGTVENIMEGLLDVLGGCDSGHGRNETPMSTVKANDGNYSGTDGNLDQDNKDYWSSLLNAVDTSLMF